MNIKQSYTAAISSPAAQAWTTDFKLLTTDGVRVINASTVMAMRTTALTMRFASITVESVNVGLGYALDHTPKTYEETRTAMTNMMDDLLDMFESDEAAKKAEEVKAVA
jgi:hypothetical protein